MGSSASHGSKQVEREKRQRIKKNNRHKSKSKNTDEIGRFYFDENGHKFYYDEDGKPFYLDNMGKACYIDTEGNAYYINPQGVKYYLDDSGAPFDIEEGDQIVYFDNLWRRFYRDEQDGSCYYKDEDKRRFYRDERGYSYRMGKKGNKLYFDKNGKRFSLDENNKPYILDKDDKSKVYLCVDDQGNVYRDQSRSERKLITLKELIEEEELDTDLTVYSKRPVTAATHKQGTTVPTPALPELPANVSEDESIEEDKEDRTFFSKNQRHFSKSTSTFPSKETSDKGQISRQSKTSLSNYIIDSRTQSNKDSSSEVSNLPNYILDDSEEAELAREAQNAAERRIYQRQLEKERERLHYLAPKPKSVRKIGEYNIKQSDDKLDCSISGCAFLDNGNLVISDYSNKKLKMFNPDLKFLSSHSLDVYPQNISIHGKESHVYVTFKSLRSNGVSVIKVEDKTMAVIQTLALKGTGYGISSSHNGLAVIVNTTHGFQIHLLDTRGVLKKRVLHELDGKPLMVKPEYITISEDLKLLVSDRGTNCVICFDTNGNVLFQHSDIREPTGLCEDKQGSVFVSSPGGVHQVSMSGLGVKTLVKREQLGFAPTAVCYDSDDDMLVVLGQSNKMVAFQLS